MSAGVAAIVLAAGESRRMGARQGAVGLGRHAPCCNTRSTNSTAPAAIRIVVVLGHEADSIAAAIRCDGVCRVVRNREYASGRASSLRAGAAALPGDVAAIVVASVDTPLSRATVRALIDAWRALPGPGAIVVPRHGGRNGHPGLFDGALLPELRAVQEESEGLRAVRRAHTKTTTFLDVDDPLVTLNLNTPEAYAAARRAHAPNDAAAGGAVRRA